VFTIEQRDALRVRTLQLAEQDERVVAGAAVGSLAVGTSDRYSDLNITFGIADSMPVPHLLEEWTRMLAAEQDAVQLADLDVGPPRRARFDRKCRAVICDPISPPRRNLYESTS
jgi:hypothetical protein